MSRRRRPRKLLIPTVWLDWTPEIAALFRLVPSDWTPEIAALFRLVPSDWTPPRKVRVCGSAQRRTWTARFTTPEGRANTARIRLEYDLRAGGWGVVEESLATAFKFRKAT